ncbi:MAG: nuclear transport factor 2 family protein [Gammaproteobacteria bacterium]|nr:nuclear transport factor 2 family protein [Gammaproteobacteria bacterium]
MEIRKSLLFITLLLLISAGARSATDEQAQILSISETLASQFNAGGTASLENFYTPDAVMLPPSSQILSKPDEITGYWSLLKGTGVREYAVYPVDLKIEGNVAYQTAIWEATRIAPDGNTFKLEGNISTVLVKQKDGRWKIKLQSWN